MRLLPPQLVQERRLRCLLGSTLHGRLESPSSVRTSRRHQQTPHRFPFKQLYERYRVVATLWDSNPLRDALSHAALDLNKESVHELTTVEYTLVVI